MLPTVHVFRGDTFVEKNILRITVLATELAINCPS